MSKFEISKFNESWQKSLVDLHCGAKAVSWHILHRHGDGREKFQEKQYAGA